MSELLDLLANYVSALEKAMAGAPSNELLVYQRRMEAAKEIGAALRHNDPRELKRLIDQEEHGQGWGFLVGSQGESAEAALTKLIYRARMSGGTFAA
jgi:hypothetical protein